MNLLQHKINLIFQDAKKLAYALHPSPLAKDVSALWETFTQERTSGLQDYFRKPPLRRAYMGYYVPLYASKLALLLTQLQKEGHFPKAPQSVLDIGAGPLVGTLASSLAFGTIPRAVAVDRQKGAMQLGLDLVRSSSQSAHLPSVDCIVENFHHAKAAWRQQGSFDLIVIAHALNELPGKEAAEQRRQVVQAALKCLTPHGRLLIVEPSHETTSRHMMQLRDELYPQNNVAILAPCTGAEHCPLLAQRGTWCHSEIQWKAPKECREIDKALGFNRTVLKCSYLLLAKGKGQLKNPSVVRIVSGAMSANGVERRYICTTEGKKTAHTGAPTGIQWLHRLTRGDLMEASVLEAHHVRTSEETQKNPKPFGKRPISSRWKK